MSYSHCQQLGQIVIVKSRVNKQAGFRLATQEWSRVSKLTQLLTLTSTHKFPLQCDWEANVDCSLNQQPGTGGDAIYRYYKY